MLLLGNLAPAPVAAQTSSPVAVDGASAAPAKPGKLAPFKERVEAALTVKVDTSILGLTLYSPLGAAHEKLDPLCEAAHPPKEEGGEAGEEREPGRKVLWQLAKTDYSSIFVKTDAKERITYILANLRPGRERPFGKIGELEKAPVQSESTVAWDMIRPKHSLFRLVARGADGKASSITLFVVK
jgi:hypothetical protein